MNEINMQWMITKWRNWEDDGVRAGGLVCLCWPEGGWAGIMEDSRGSSIYNFRTHTEYQLSPNSDG